MSNIADLKELSSSVDFWGTTTGFNSDRLCEILAFAVNSVEKLEASERQRDELRTLAEEQSRLAGINAARALTAEAEIARRDADAGEPFAYIDSAHLDEFGWGYVFKHSSPMRMACESPVYTAAPPAVLPPPLDNWHISASGVIQSLQFNGDELSFTAGANWMRQQCLEMGAQQQKVVELNNVFSINVARVAVRVVLLKDLYNSLDAANVKWEVKK